MRKFGFLWLLLWSGISLAQTQGNSSSNSEKPAGTIEAQGSFEVTSGEDKREVSFTVETAPDYANLSASEHEHLRQQVLEAERVNGEKLPIFILDTDQTETDVSPALQREFSFERVKLPMMELPPGSAGANPEAAERFRAGIQVQPVKESKLQSVKSVKKVEKIDLRLARIYMAAGAGSVLAVCITSHWSALQIAVGVTGAVSMAMINTLINQHVSRNVNRGLVRSKNPFIMIKNALVTGTRSIKYDLSQAIARNMINSFSGKGIGFEQLAADKIVGIYISGAFSSVKNMIFRTGDPRPGYDINYYNRPAVLLTSAVTIPLRSTEELMNIASLHNFPIHLAFHGLKLTENISIPSFAFDAVYHLKASVVAGIVLYVGLTVVITKGTPWAIRQLKKVNAWMYRVLFKEGLADMQARELDDERLRANLCRLRMAGETVAPVPYIPSEILDE